MEDYNTLVLSGGALKGFSLLGCLQCLADDGLSKGIKKFIGTSVGAIISYLLCIGYTPIEIMVELCKNDWLEKMANFDIINAVNNSGAISFSVITEVLERLTIDKIDHFITLGELYTEFGKELICCTYNFTQQKQEFVGPHDHPDLPCLVALRMTSNLPILFEPYLYDENYYLDGAVICNFPLFKVHLEKDVAIGIKFKKPMSKNITHLVQFIYDLIIIPSISLEEIMNKRHLEVVDVIEMDVQELHSFNFNLSKNDRLDMFSLGYETGKNFIKKKRSALSPLTQGPE